MSQQAETDYNSVLDKLKEMDRNTECSEMRIDITLTIQGIESVLETGYGHGLHFALHPELKEKHLEHLNDSISYLLGEDTSLLKER